MGVEQFVDGPVAGKRKAKRARVLLAAKLQLANGGEIEARLRDLSRKGALVECQTVPPVGTELVFNRGSTSIPARVAWTGSDRVGLEFAYMIDEHEVLVQLKRTTATRSAALPPPALFGESMSHQRSSWPASGGLVASPSGE